MDSLDRSGLAFPHFQYVARRGEPLHLFGPGENFEAEDLTNCGGVAFQRSGWYRSSWNTRDDLPAAERDPDFDGDGLSDWTELFGSFHAYAPVPAGIVHDPWLRNHGSDPCRKTIAVEVDWLDDQRGGTDKPSQDALDQARQMFADAPIGGGIESSPPFHQCPYYSGTIPSGIQLLIDASPEGRILVEPDRRTEPLSTMLPGGGTRFDEYRNGTGTLFPRGNFTPGRAGLFIYSLWGYKWKDSEVQGYCCLGPHQNDFVGYLDAAEHARARLDPAIV